jgi:hypothetical protein
VLRHLPGAAVPHDWERYRIYNEEFDLTGPIEWRYTEGGEGRLWPSGHYSRINYRPGNPYGDVRLNWELNRLQFLPSMAVADEDLARKILAYWLDRNRYLSGPAYIASMEVALRWISIYRAVCLFKKPLEAALEKELVGLALVSGRYIEGRLSTHSSAGNHLIVEAVGLFWLGCALENLPTGAEWKEKARNILSEQVARQINEDGTNQEQTFWYLGFVVDALLHYFLLEETDAAPPSVLKRAEAALQFIADTISPTGAFPDYGDRDDGFVFRVGDDYSESPFPGLLSIGAGLFSRPDWMVPTRRSAEAVAFWPYKPGNGSPVRTGGVMRSSADSPSLKNYKDGGMTSVAWDKCKVLFRHSRLGLDDTAGHGHADALSVILSWNDVPVLVDLGSGQYNGDQSVRNYFRSTVAHNTVEVNGRDQAQIVGPFLWDRPYEGTLLGMGESPHLYVEASHNGYEKQFGITHIRRLEGASPRQWTITDRFTNADGAMVRGAFHFGKCRNAVLTDNRVVAEFDGFAFTLTIPADFDIELFYGSEDPFLGWISTVYGKWEPIHCVVFSKRIGAHSSFEIGLGITD